jgi:outer membrane protein TolC
MSADQVAAEAVRVSPNVARARAASEQAAAAASQALVAVYPRLDLEGRYTRLSEQSTATALGDIVGPSGDVVIPSQTIDVPPPLVNRYLLQATLSYAVSDLFLQILPRYEASQRRVEAEALSAEAERRAVDLAAREAFYSYVGARAALLVARAGLTQAESQHRDVEALVNAGALARVELMRADAAVASARVAEAQAAGNLAVARTSLFTMIDRTQPGDLAVAEDLTQPLSPPKEDEAALLEMALENRSEMQAMRVLADMHESLRDATLAEKLPRLSVGASYELGNPNARASPFDQEWTGTWTALASVTWSPNDFFTGDARADQSGADLARTRADMAALADALRMEVTGALERYRAAATAMEAALVGVRAAEESYRVRREQFRAGAAVATDVVDADEKLQRARLQLINAAIDARIARARLDRAVERPQG